MWRLSNFSKRQEMRSLQTARVLVLDELWLQILSSMNRALEAAQHSASSRSSTLTRTLCQLTPRSTSNSQRNSQAPPAYRPEFKLLAVTTLWLAAPHHPDGFKPGSAPAQDGAATKAAPASSVTRR